MSAATWGRQSREHLDAWLERRQRRHGSATFKFSSPATMASIGISVTLVLLITASAGVHHVVKRAHEQQLADAKWQLAYWKCVAARSAVVREACIDEIRQPTPTRSVAELAVLNFATRVLPQ